MQVLSRLQKCILYGLLFAVFVLFSALIWMSVAADDPASSPAVSAAASGKPMPALTPVPTSTSASTQTPALTAAPTLTPAPTPIPTPASTQTPPVSSDDKLIALTFDDGPGPYTDRLLDALKDRGIHVTFFVIGVHVQRYPEVLARISEDGHEIANHTMGHKLFRNLSAAETAKQISDCSDLIEDLTGSRPTLLRVPGGEFSAANLREFKRQGLASVNWWVDTQDWRTQDKEKILEEVFFGKDRAARDGAIVLLHDIYEPTIDAAIEMIDRLMADGYRIVTVTELLNARKGGVTPGKTYIEGFPEESD